MPHTDLRPQRGDARRTVRSATAAVTALLVLGLGACGASPDDPAAPGAVQTDTGQAAGAGGALPAAGEYGTMGDGKDIPPIPEIVVPDVTTLTESAERIGKEFGNLAAPGTGVLVTGAVCDAAGRVANGSSMTAAGGSGRVERPTSSTVNNGDGSGRHETATETIVINADGSGRYETPTVTIVINKDGSGHYETATETIVINADGSGRHETATETIVINADGSGHYETATETIVINADGSGHYETATTTVMNNGDGTGTYETATSKVERKMDPLPTLTKVGKFPPVKSLTPLGSNCGSLVRLEDRVLFDFGSATLRAGAGPVLDAVARAAGDVTGTIRINGHTDSVGSDESNLELSLRRAQAVAKALADRGVTAKISIEGLGETQPVAPNTVNGKDNPAGRQLNRRVDVVLPPS